MTLKEKIPTLSDERLNALSFNAWRIASGGNETRRRKAKRLRPLLQTEIARREASKA